jgi:hypothetical protein
VGQRAQFLVPFATFALLFPFPRSLPSLPSPPSLLFGQLAAVLSAMVAAVAHPQMRLPIHSHRPKDRSICF